MQFFELADLLIANGAHANQEIGRGDQYKKDLFLHPFQAFIRRPRKGSGSGHP